jgi:hypothetical protein
MQEHVKISWDNYFKIQLNYFNLKWYKSQDVTAAEYIFEHFCFFLPKLKLWNENTLVP